MARFQLCLKSERTNITELSLPKKSMRELFEPIRTDLSALRSTLMMALLSLIRETNLKQVRKQFTTPSNH